MVLTEIVILITMEWWWYGKPNLYFFCSSITASHGGYRLKHVGENLANKTHHKYRSAFAGYLYILDKNKVCVTDNNFTFQTKAFPIFFLKI